MILRTAAAGLSWYAAQRRRAWERASSHAAAVQEKALLRMVSAACDTEFVRLHGFDVIRSVDGYQARVPLRTYTEFQPLWARAAEGETDVAWPGRPRYWVKTSGTTAGDIIQVMTEGFLLHDRLLRPAKVGVSSMPKS